MQLKYSLILLTLFLGVGCGENTQQVKPSQTTVALELVNQGAIKGISGDKIASLKDFNEAIRLNPNLADAYYNRGLIYLDLGKYDEGLADFDEAIRLKPEFSKSYHGKGIIYLEIGQLEKALDNLTISIEMLPTYGRSYYYRSFVYNKLGNNKKALEDMKQASKLSLEQGELSLAHNAQILEKQLSDLIHLEQVLEIVSSPADSEI